MTTIFYTATTLDGFLADEKDSLDWLFVQDIDEEGAMNYSEFIANVGATVMGRTTYEWVRDHLARTGEKWSYDMPSWVLTHADLEPIEGADIRFTRGDVRPVHAEMRAAAGGRNLWLVGGGDLVGQFHDAGLLDEVIVQVGSVTLGAGKPLLPRAIIQPPLRLLSARAVGTGFAELHYEVPRTPRDS